MNVGASRQVLLLLDVDSPWPVDEIWAQLPAATERKVLSLRSLGAPVLARWRNPDASIDWEGLRRAVDSLVDEARAEVQTQGPPVHFVLCGLAPLPVFFLLGRSLPSRLGQQTFVNRRPDGTWDKMTLSTPAGEGGALFDVIRGLPAPASALLGEKPRGRIAVFLSCLGFVPKEERQRELLRRHGQLVAGMVEIRSSRPTLLDESNVARAAAELSCRFQECSSAYPEASGVALFIAGPAHLAFLAGRVLPASLADAWIANHQPATDTYQLAYGSVRPGAATVQRLTLQVYGAGEWHDAAELTVSRPQLGRRSPTRLDYDTGYYFTFGHAAEAAERVVCDARALSVRSPVVQDATTLLTWPPFLLDLLPQGHARRRLAAELGLVPESEEADLPLLLRSAGAPVGNVRVKEAWAAEQERLRGLTIAGITTDDIVGRNNGFRELMERFALLASGSSGVQGELPKILLTRAEDGLWYPDSYLPDERAREHALVKLSRGRFPEDRLILAAEAGYLAVAREFGLRAAEVLDHAEDVLILRRFDRLVSATGVLRLGQESLVAASGAAEFGVVTTHEAYLRVLCEFCTDWRADIVEYILRDLLNRAMGDTDNHGRNTALQKRDDGWVGLSPRFDFAPMKLDPSLIAPATSWACLRDVPKGPVGWRYARICAAVRELTGSEDTAAAVAEAVAACGARLAQLPEIARRQGVQGSTLDRVLNLSAMD